MNTKKWNWALWAGFLVCVIALLSFLFFFVNFPATRDFPWANLLLFSLAALLLIMGLRRAYGQAELYRGKIFGPILAALSAAILTLFVFGVFVESRRMPASHGAPQVGQKAPEFDLMDTNAESVKLSELLSALRDPASPATASTVVAPKGVLLVFYRGYW